MKKEKKPKQPGRWRRRAIWLLCIVIVLAVVLRAVLPLALPTVMRKVAEQFGLTCSYDRLELNLFSGDAGIWGLQFLPKEGGAAVLAADYCHGNVSVLNLFRGKLNVWRVEADGVEVNIDRNADGHIPLLDRFVAATSSTRPAPAAPAPVPTSAGTVDLASPVRVDALRLGHIHVHIHDRGVTPEIDTELAMDLRLSDLGSTVSPARFEMNLSADPMLDSMKVTGEGRSGGKNLDASIQVVIRGIRLKPIAAYLTPFGIRPVSDGINLRAEGQVHTTGAPNGAEGFTGSIAFDHLSAFADRDEAMALDHLKIDAGVIDTKSIHFNSIILDGVRATAGRAEDGNVRVAGIEYDPTLIVPGNSAPPQPPAGAPTPPMFAALLAERWSVGKIALRNAKLELHDHGITPAVDLSFVVDDLSAKSIDHDPKNLNTAVTLSGMLHVPGLIRDIKLDGTATPFADDKHFKATANVTGIKPDAIKPYLDQIGIESTLKDGQCTAAMDASLSIGDIISANLNVTNFDFRDESPLLAMSAIKVSKATFDPKTAKLGVGDVELSGPGISVLRDPEGHLNMLGLRTKPATAHAASAIAASPARTAAPTTAPAFSIAALPKITVEKFGWKNIQVNLEDRTENPPVKVSLSDIGVEASDISTDLDNKIAGHFRAVLVSPDVAKQLELTGNLSPRADGLSLDANVNGSGLNSTGFATYLKPLGIEPVLRDGAFTLHASADVTQSNAGLSASMGLDHLRYTAGEAELAGVDGVQVNGISLRDGVIGVDAIEITHPRASARRDADGSLVAGGVRLNLSPAPGTTGEGDSASQIARTADQNHPLPAHGARRPEVPATQPVAPMVVKLKKITVKDARINWDDLAIKPSVNTNAETSFELSDLTLGRDARPADLHLTAHAAGTLDHLTVTGKISAAPTRQLAVLDISASGLRVGPLSAYLPPGMASSLKDGQFHTTIDAGFSPNPAGGIAAQLLVGALNYQDGVGSAPLFQLDSVRVIVPRVDLPINSLAVDEISVVGVQTHAERNADRTIACLGFVLQGSPESRAVPAGAGAPQTRAGRSGSPVALAIPLPTTGPSVKDLIAASHRVLPNVTVEKLDLNVAKLTLTDLARPESSPLVVSDLRLHNVNRIDWLGKEAANKPPTHLNFVCKVSPIVDQVTVDAMLLPFARQPSVQIDFAAAGVHGDGLTKLVPELKDQLDGSSMGNGIASGHFEAEAKLDRQSPIDFNVSHGFDLTFDLTKVQYRAEPDGPVLAGVDEVRSDNIRIAPADSIVHFKTLEIDKPIGFVTQDDKGIHVLGWVYKLPVGSTQPVVAVKSAPQQTAPATTAKPTGVAINAKPPAGEVRVDKLLISGLDFRVEDNAVTPPMVIPLNGLDVEVRNLSSRSPYEDKPIRFSAIVNADKVKLRKKGTQVLEDRDLFSQITANGEVSLYPQLHGWAKTSVSGLDLAALQGPAKQFGEDLTSGVYDSTVDLRFDPTGAVAITSKFTLTDLTLSEPPNGLIYRTLHLPAPLDAAIGAVEGADGSIGLPLNVSLDPKHISYVDLGLAAGGGVSQVIVTAIAAAPLKAANDVGSLIGLGSEKSTEDLTTKIVFSPGSAAVGANQFSALVPLLKKLRKDDSLTVTLRHQVGSGDVHLAGVRANPTKDQCNALEQQLRSRKAELLQLRGDTAGQARANLASLGATAAAPALERLKAIDRELAGTEESLDQIGELLKPGADRLADRRTKSATIQIAADRLSSIQSVLIAQGIAGDRVKTVAATFNPEPTLNGGQIVISVVVKK